MLGEYSFRPRAWALAAAAAACAAGIALGNWQSRRAEEKEALATMRDEALRAAPLAVPATPVQAAHYALRRVEARGVFRPEHTVFLDNKLRGGRVGYEVLTPLHLGQGMHALVNRGWVAAGASREALPQVRTPGGEQRVEGLALGRLPRRFNPGGRSGTGPVRQEVELAAFAEERGLALQPFFIEQHGETDDGLLRDWPKPHAGAEKHEMYALQWYSLAGLSVALFIVFSVRRARAAEK
jgi:surfeit locus 1 family protein